MERRHLKWSLAVIPLLLVATCFAEKEATERTLTATGYSPAAGSPTEFFAARARRGLTPAAVAAAMPGPGRVERFIAPEAGGDSLLLERYVYGRGLGRWDVYIYYTRGGGVVDVYAQDVPGISGAHPISAAEAEAWRRWPSQ